MPSPTPNNDESGFLMSDGSFLTGNSAFLGMSGETFFTNHDLEADEGDRGGEEEPERHS